MPRIQFSDVTPPERRSIRDVPIPNSGKRKVPIVLKKTTPKTEPVSFDTKMSEITEKKESGTFEYYYPKKETEQHEDTSKKSKNKFVFGGIVVVLVILFIVGMMTIFASATINIIPKTQEIDVNTKIIATADKLENSVRYEVIKLSESKTVSVSATGEEAVEVKASGKIVIYNNFSTEPQRLIVRTRFESPEGLIFRIPESVMVPGKSIKNGVETPGSIEVKVFADEAGEKYNIKKTDFTVPGFKNDANRFKNFYARSNTNMENGFIGKRKVVAPNDRAVALQSVDSEVNANLKKGLESKIPEELVLLDGSVIYESRELAPKEENSSVMSVIIGKEITAYAIMLNKQDLSDKITKEYISQLADWDNIKPMIKDFSLLKIKNTINNPKSGDKIDLEINGKIKVLADININIINQRMLGASKGDVAKLIDEFAGISSITAAIRPIWKQSFPDNPSKIYVQTIIGE